jgi:glutaredoxin
MGSIQANRGLLQTYSHLSSHCRRTGFAAALAAALSLVAAAPGCGKKDDDGTAPRALDEKLPSLSIGDDTPNLMLTWVDTKGETHVELRPADVPAEGRPLVRVVVADREDGTGELFYVVDLTKKRDDGTWVAQTMPRRAWEALIAKRREEHIAKTAPPPPPPPAVGTSGAPAAPPPPSPPTAMGGLTAIIYGADWCGPCHEAAAYLKSKGVQVVEKNVEKSPEAQAEMRSKLAKSGRHGGSIPVIDVRGQVVVGFSKSSLDRAIATALGGGTVL